MSHKKYIDVSYWQGDIDWTKVKGEVDGVIIRAGYGQNNIDKKFKEYISECNRLGIPCGVYWFSYAYTEAMARKEAEYCLAAIKPYKVELPVCFDFEYDSVDKAKAKGVAISKALATAMVHAFCGAVEAAGYYAMNYTNKDYLNKYFDDTTLKYDLWLAQWPNKPNLEKPPEGVGIWQYSSKGSVAGIKGDVDMDAAYKDYKAIIAKAGLNGKKKDEVKEEVKPWYSDALAWAVEKGISDGTKHNTPVTRAELWDALYKMYGK